MKKIEKSQWSTIVDILVGIFIGIFIGFYLGRGSRLFNVIPARNIVNIKKEKKINVNWSSQIIEFNVDKEIYKNDFVTVKIKLRNIGKNSWNKNSKYKVGLRPVNFTHVWTENPTIAVDKLVRPGESINIKFKIKAPNRKGKFPFFWRMYWQKEEQWQLFGEPIQTTIEII